MLVYRKKRGFTLIELLVVVIVIGIVAAISGQYLLGAQNKARLAAVKSNMHTVQVASECYATDSGGAFASTGGSLDPFFTQGGNSIGGAAGKKPQNPFSGVPDQTLYAEVLSTSALISSTRAAPPTAGPGTKGMVGYCQADGGLAYAVSGVDEGGRRAGGPNDTTLVLSNQ